MSQVATRIEHDLRGDRAVPAEAYYGIHTLRALEISGSRDRDLHLSGPRVCARRVKQRRRSRTTPSDCFPDGKAGAIARACEEIREAAPSISSSWTSSRAGRHLDN